MTLRRDFLSMTAGAVAARTVLPMAAKAQQSAQLAPKGSDNPDAALIAACNEFVALELQLCATFNYEDTAEQEDAREPERAAIYARQDPLQDVIEQTPARTLDGIRAKARALVAWEEDAIKTDATLTADVIRGSLLRDLIDADDPVMWAKRATA